MYQNKLFSFLAFGLLTFGVLYLYIDLSGNWVAVGLGYSKFNNLIYQFEFPFVIAVFSLLHFSEIKNWFVRFLLPLVPLLILYLLFDGFYNFLGRSPYPSDFQNIKSIWLFSPLMALAIIFMFLCIPAIIFFLIVSARRSYSEESLNNFKLSITLRSLLVIVFVFILTTDKFKQFHNQQFKYVVWSQEDTVRENGKFSSFIYYNNQEIQNKNKLKQFINNDKPLDIHAALYPGKIDKPRNIHLIVLESFIDPREIENVIFSQPILAKELEPYLNPQSDGANNGKFSLVTSPIYGGGTAQAEFELLTGVPALSKVNRIEFNVMKGSPINSFIERLKQNNYRTFATIATSPGFFNSKDAYKSLGFENISYLEEKPEFAQELKNGPLFDGDVFEHNIEQVKYLLKQNKMPVFNYVLGMYGHRPFIRNEIARPDVVKVIHPNSQVTRIANQFYYRTQAIANYLKELMKTDENAIIFLTSDHLPSIFGKEIIYKLAHKTNISLFFDRKINIDVTGKKHYQLPWFIWDKLTEKDHQRQLSESVMESLYFQALAESMAD